MATVAKTNATQAGSGQISTKEAISPFQVDTPEAELTELRRRINETRWPERETVGDQAQGVQLATMLKLARYWATEYDWRKVERRLKALPQFTTEIDGLDIYFMHVRSKHDNALPNIVAHGWPGSMIGQLKIIDPLVKPTSHGGQASDAFDVVISQYARLRILREADHDWLGLRAHRTCLDCADETPWIHTFCGARGRLGWGGC